MEQITIALVLLAAVVISGIIARASPLPIPLPLVQIAFGAVIAAFGDLGVVLDPHIFFLLFLPPLLFLDGWRIPKEGLSRDKGTIIELAFGLVFFTVIGVGYFINWMIPGVPLPVGFALAAILSPTDPIAVSAIAKRTPIPKRLLHILEGESLLNDASGLVCMRFAVAAAMTGAFDPGIAFVTFLRLAFGGIAIGIAVTEIIVVAKTYVSRRFGEETGSQILISLLIPFAAYMLAERFETSGILAAVAAGITMSRAELQGIALAVTRVRRAAVWDTVQFTLNGIIFVLLGEQLPRIASGAADVVQHTGHLHPAWLLVYVLAVFAALSVLRFVWVWVSLRFTMYRAAWKGAPIRKPGWRMLAVATLAGARGAITLAAVLSLPLMLYDGSPFPARDLAIFIAGGVIIVSLVAASIGLPLLLKGLVLPPEEEGREEEDHARTAAAEAAIKAIERQQHAMGKGKEDADLYADVAARVMEDYRERLEGTMKGVADAAQIRKAHGIEKALRLAAIRAERDEIYRLSREARLPSDVVRKLVREVDLLEARYVAA
jgi:CPA1 family monovalent cation:H+ antiporter